MINEKAFEEKYEKLEKVGSFPHQSTVRCIESIARLPRNVTDNLLPFLKWLTFSSNL